MQKKLFISIVLLLGGVLILSACTQKSPANSNVAPNIIGNGRQEIMQPKEVIAKFMKHTLGSLPDSEINYEIAKTYMTDDYRAEFDNPMFVPIAYGMQDGPDKVDFVSEEIDGDNAQVIYLGYWGSDNQMYWKFELKKQVGNWKLNFINPGQ